MKARNWMPAAILRSPFHRLMSDKFAILTFTGRRSGRRYSTPVAYYQVDSGTVLVATDSAWWRNLVDRPDVGLRLAGRQLNAAANVITDRGEASEALTAMVRARPALGRWFNVTVHDGEPDVDEVDTELDRGRIPIRLGLMDG